MDIEFSYIIKLLEKNIINMSVVINIVKKYFVEFNLGKFGFFLFKISGLFGLKFKVKSNVLNNK